MIHTNQILLWSNWLQLSQWPFTHVFKKIKTTMRWNCMSKALPFFQITAKHQAFPFFSYWFLTIKTSSQNISIINAPTDSVLTSRTSRRLLEEKAPVNDFRRIVSNGVISLLWQLRCHCNPDHDKFSSLPNTTVVAIFPNVGLERRSLCSNLARQVLTLKNCIQSLSYANTA